MSHVLTVFLPNKQRYRLEISNSTPLYQGLEQVCTEKGYIPAHSYAFRHNKAYPDLGTPVGMLNLSNLVELELILASEVPAKRSGTAAAAVAGAGSSDAASDAVSIGLQYGAQRHIETISCDTSLWDVICQFSAKHPGWIPSEPPSGDQHPVLVYTRHEVPGAVALRHTSLRQIGLSPGGAPALLRLLYRPVPPERLAAAGQLAESRGRAAAASAQPPSSTSSEKDVEPETPAATSAVPNVAENATHSSAIGTESNANLFSPFREVPRWSEADAADSQRGRQAAGANVAREPRTLAEALNLPDFDSLAHRTAAAQLVQAAPVEAHFGPERPFKFPEETAGQDLYQNELSEVRPTEFAACDRRLCAYLAGVTAPTTAAAAESGAGAMELEEPDDGFFNVTESDIRKMAADLKRKVEDETSGPLLTRQQREQRREDLYSCYEHTVIRLFFPDRRVVQAAFRPRETVHALYKFVHEQLLSESALSAGEFYLYTTPPKKEITDMAQFLIHADLVPMPIVYVGFRGQLPEGQSFLKPTILELVASREECDRVALACMKSAVEPIYARQQQQQQQQSRSTASSGPSAKRAGNMVPKWFKK